MVLNRDTLLYVKKMLVSEIDEILKDKEDFNCEQKELALSRFLRKIQMLIDGINPYVAKKGGFEDETTG